MILGTAGHIDHGKTTLVRALTGVNTDRLPEERRRGITIELGFAPLVLDDGTVLGVVDVPGHEAFVRTMVAGAAGVDLALLVVAADEGVMPQTREHAAILALLGVTRGVVALTKCDLVDAEWLELVREDVHAFLATTSLVAAPVLETAAGRGRGIPELRAAIGALARELPRAAPDDLFRMPVDRSFSVKGTGTVVTGTVWSGVVRRDDVVRVLPGGASARVRAVQAHGEAVAESPPRGRAALALAAVDVAAVPRGATLVAGDGWAPTTSLRADVELLPDAQPLGPRTRVRLHLGTAEVGARVVAAGDALRPGARVPARLVLEEPLVARGGDRFVLRGGAQGSTVGGGQVTDPLPGQRRPRPWPVTAPPPAERLRLVLAEAGTAGVARASLPVRLGLPPAVAARHLASDEVVALGERAYSPAAVEERARRLRELVDDEHSRVPLGAGASLQTVRARLGVPDELAERLVRDALAAGTMELRGGMLCRAGWQPRPTVDQEALQARLLAEVEGAGEEPPTAEELIRRHGPVAGDLLRLLERRGDLRLVGGERYYSAPTLATLLERLRSAMEPGVVYAPADLRERLGLSRRLAMPLLEYADHLGITIRRADGRVRADPAR